MKQVVSFYRLVVPNSLISLWSHAGLAVLILGMTPSVLAGNATETSQTQTEVGKKETTASGPNILMGNTAMVEYELDDIDSYREAMTQLQKRNFSGAEHLFKKTAALLGEGHEKYRAECLYFQAGCLVMMGKIEEATSLYKAAVNLFEQYDYGSPYKPIAITQLNDLHSAKSAADKDKLYSSIATQHARISIDQHIGLAGGVTGGNTIHPFLVRVERTSIPETVYNCFAQMSCLETAEIGSNMTNAASRFQPLLVEGNPAAFAIGASYPVINVKVNGHPYKINVKLPSLRGSREILLVSDKEKICALDLNSYETWLLRMDRGGDGLLNSVQWVKLLHRKPNVKPSISAPTWNRPVTGAFGTSGKRSNSWLDSSQQPRRFIRGRNGRKAEVESGF